MASGKIPESARPFVATVNGKKYVYDPGQTVDVPEEVAVLIRSYYESQKDPESWVPDEKVDKDPESAVPFAIGLDDGGLYCVTK